MDHYKVLRLFSDKIGPNSTLKELNKAYKKLALQFHPDKWEETSWGRMSKKQQDLARDIIKDYERKTRSKFPDLLNEPKKFANEFFKILGGTQVLLAPDTKRQYDLSSQPAHPQNEEKEAFAYRPAHPQNEEKEQYAYYKDGEEYFPDNELYDIGSSSSGRLISRPDFLGIGYLFLETFNGKTGLAFTMIDHSQLRPKEGFLKALINHPLYPIAADKVFPLSVRIYHSLLQKSSRPSFFIEAPFENWELIQIARKEDPAFFAEPRSKELVSYEKELEEQLGDHFLGRYREQVDRKIRQERKLVAEKSLTELVQNVKKTIQIDLNRVLSPPEKPPELEQPSALWSVASGFFGKAANKEMLAPEKGSDMNLDKYSRLIIFMGEFARNIRDKKILLGSENNSLTEHLRILMTEPETLAHLYPVSVPDKGLLANLTICDFFDKCRNIEAEISGANPSQVVVLKM